MNKQLDRKATGKNVEPTKDSKEMLDKKKSGKGRRLWKKQEKELKKLLE